MRKRVKILPVLFVLVLFLLASSMIWAYTGGTLQGTVIDANQRFALSAVRIAVLGMKIFGTTSLDWKKSI